MVPFPPHLYRGWPKCSVLSGRVASAGGRGPDAVLHCFPPKHDSPGSVFQAFLEGRPKWADEDTGTRKISCWSGEGCVQVVQHQGQAAANGGEHRRTGIERNMPFCNLWGGGLSSQLLSAGDGNGWRCPQGEHRSSSAGFLLDSAGGRTSSTSSTSIGTNDTK